MLTNALQLINDSTGIMIRNYYWKIGKSYACANGEYHALFSPPKGEASTSGINLCRLSLSRNCRHEALEANPRRSCCSFRSCRCLCKLAFDSVRIEIINVDHTFFFYIWLATCQYFYELPPNFCFKITDQSSCRMTLACWRRRSWRDWMAMAGQCEGRSCGTIMGPSSWWSGDLDDFCVERWVICFMNTVIPSMGRWSISSLLFFPIRTN